MGLIAGFESVNSPPFPLSRFPLLDISHFPFSLSRLYPRPVTAPRTEPV